MKLIFWYCERLDDSDHYSIRCTTKKACLNKLNELGAVSNGSYYETSWGAKFNHPTKITLYYTSAFELMDACSGESGWVKLL